MSSCTNIRQTVGGAQRLVTPFAAIASSMPRALKRGWLAIKTVAPAFQGAKRQDQACLAQPGEEIFKCTSPGRKPSTNMVERCPTG